MPLPLGGVLHLSPSYSLIFFKTAALVGAATKAGIMNAADTRKNVIFLSCIISITCNIRFSQRAI